MNYRHAYHAGNFADVLKHITLALVIDYLKRKDAAFRVIDTHAGIGRYDLSSPEAQKTGEWRDGIGRLIGPAAEPIDDPALAELLAPYRDVVRRQAGLPPEPTGAHSGPSVSPPAEGGAIAELDSYPGSPWLARRLLRPGDKLIANELHPDDNAALARLFARDKQVSVMGLDGWTALKSLLPPPERRGVILIDPPFEEAGELDRLVTGLEAAVKRFATGVYLLWYPIKDPKPVARMQRRMAQLGLAKLMRIELSIGDDSDPGVLSGCGLIVVNPPYLLEQQLARILPELARRLTVCAEQPGSYRLDWLAK